MNPGELFLVNFPFSSKEQEPFKRRPVLIVGVGSDNLSSYSLVSMVTSSATRFANPSQTDIVLDDWKAAGLTRESVVRTQRLWTAEPRDFAKKLGTVTPETLVKVRAMVSSLVTST